jgi:hypothetical protein
MSNLIEKFASVMAFILILCVSILLISCTILALVSIYKETMEILA